MLHIIMPNKSVITGRRAPFPVASLGISDQGGFPVFLSIYYYKVTQARIVLAGRKPHFAFE